MKPLRFSIVSLVHSFSCDSRHSLFVFLSAYQLVQQQTCSSSISVRISLKKFSGPSIFERSFVWACFILNWGMFSNWVNSSVFFRSKSKVSRPAVLLPSGTGPEIVELSWPEEESIEFLLLLQEFSSDSLQKDSSSYSQSISRISGLWVLLPWPQDALTRLIRLWIFIVFYAESEYRRFYAEVIV